MLGLLRTRPATLGEFPASDEDWYADLRPFGPYVVEAVQAELRAERLPADVFGTLDPQDVRLAITADRRTRGFVSQMAFEVRYVVGHRGGLEHCDPDDLNHWLRRTLRNVGQYEHPIDLVAQRLAAGGRGAR